MQGLHKSFDKTWDPFCDDVNSLHVLEMNFYLHECSHTSVLSDYA